MAEQTGILRVMTDADLENVLSWRNHIDVRRFMYTQHEIALEEHRRWFAAATQDNTKSLLVYEVEGIPTGFVQFTQLNTSKNADWGFYLAPDAVKGTGKYLGKSALSYAFQQRQWHKVCGQALAFNEKSIRFHLALGFRQEGVLREQHYDGAIYHNVMCFGLLASEWCGKIE
jgi:UDP-4-amino-4,6-dideoxy-N-acetyl-beta-L-altrosamine N-acetyltransferase